MRHKDGFGRSPSIGSRNLGIFLLTVSAASAVMIVIMGRAQLIDFESSILNQPTNPTGSQNGASVQQTTTTPAQLTGSTAANKTLVTSVAPSTSVSSVNSTTNIASFDRTNFGTLLAYPDKYAGLPISISGKIYDIVNLSRPEGDIVTLKIHVDAAQANDAYRAVVFYQGAHGSAPSSQLGACAFLTGLVRGGILESSSLGKSIVIPAIDSHSLKETSCIDSSMPAEKSLNLGITQSLNGIVVEAQQVQYAPDHTRIELSIENQAAGSTVFIKEAHVLQNGTIHQQLVGIPSFETFRITNAIEPGQKVMGFIFFDRISQTLPASFTVIVEKAAISGPTDSTFIFRAG